MQRIWRHIASLDPLVTTAVLLALTFLPAALPDASGLIGRLIDAVKSGSYAAAIFAFATAVMAIHASMSNPGARLRLGYTAYGTIVIVLLASAFYISLTLLEQGPSLQSTLRPYSSLISTVLLLPVVSLLYLIWASANSLCRAEHGRNPKVHELIGTAFLVLYLPLTSWLIQPRVKKVLSRGTA